VRAAEVILRRRAREDIDSAVSFYLEEGAPAAAHGLLDELAAALATIARHPDSGSPRYAELLAVPGLRTRVLRGHPYLLFYRVSGGRVHIWRVLHSARDIPESLAPEEER
jgi:toxin ParE1/3/4